MNKKLAALATAAALVLGGTITAAPAQAVEKTRCVELVWQSQTDINILNNYKRNTWTNLRPSGNPGFTCGYLGGFYVPPGYVAELTQGIGGRRVANYYAGDHLYALRPAVDWRYRIFLHRV